MALNRTLNLLLLSTLANGGCSRQPDRAIADTGSPQPAAICGSWDQPRELRTGDGRQIYINLPQIVSLNGTYAVLGGPVRLGSVGDSAAILTRGFAGAVVAGDGRATLIPSPAVTVTFPRVAREGRLLHMLWGEADDTTLAMPPIQRLKYASWDGTRWTHSVVLAEQDGLRWTPASESRLRSTPWGLLAAVPVYGPGRVSHILVLRRSALGWGLSRIPMSSFPGYVDMAAFSETHLVVVYVTATGPGDRNSLLASTSLDGGTTWTAPTVIHSGRSGEAHFPMITGPVAGEILVTAAQFQSSGDSVMSFASRNGEEWRRVAAAPAGGRIYVFHADERPSGDVDVLVGVANAEPGIQRFVVGAAGGALRCQPPSLQGRGIPGAIESGSDRPFMVWSETRDLGLGRPREMVTLYSTLVHLTGRGT